jgi:hypothetical protein
MTLCSESRDGIDIGRSIADGGGHYFRLTSTWTLDASAAEVADIVGDAESISRWWSSSFLRAEVVQEGDGDRRGATVRLHSKGLLPHTFQFLLRVTTVRYPECICFAVRGDFEGDAMVVAREEDGRLLLFFDWRVTIHQPLIRPLVPLARWLFVMNHRWSMRSGERALQREILIRRGRLQARRHRPTFPHNIALVLRLYRWRPTASDWRD